MVEYLCDTLPQDSFDTEPSRHLRYPEDWAGLRMGIAMAQTR